MKKILGAAFITIFLSSANTVVADDEATQEIEIERVWKALEAAQAKIEDLESRTNMSPFAPPKSLGFSEGSVIDPVQSAYPIEKGDYLRLAQVHFNVSSMKMTPGAERLTLEAAEWIKSLPQTEKILVAGFSDTVGPADVNKRLSKQRASIVASMLIEAGLDPASIEVVGFGEEGLPEKTGDNVAEPLNRCVGIFTIPAKEEKT